MSLFAPRTEGEARFQYCNYGYDKSLYISFDDCMENYGKSKAQMQSKLETEQVGVKNNERIENYAIYGVLALTVIILLKTILKKD